MNNAPMDLRTTLEHGAVDRRTICVVGTYASLSLLSRRSAQAAQWPREWQADQVIFHADFIPENHQSVTVETANLCRSLPSELGLRISDDPIYIYWFQTRGMFEQYVKHYFPMAPMRRALFIKQRGPGMVFAYDSKDIAVDLRHETTHAVLHTMLPMVPLWLDEGIAEYFEVPETERIRQHPHLKRVRRQVRWRRVPSLSKLESIGRLANMGNEEYEQAWSWVHFMLHGPTEARRELSDFLRQIQANSPPEPLSRRLPRVIPNVDREFRHHFRNLA